MKHFKVLWIDDDPSDSFLSEAFELGIDIDIKTCHNDGIAALNDPNKSYDAIILDANCKITNETTEKPSLDSLTESIYKVHEFCTLSKLIPWFVYTGGGYQGFKDLEGRIPKRSWDDTKYYNKPIDRHQLFNKIKLVVENINSVEWSVKNKHHEVFEIFDTISPFNSLGENEKAMLLKLLVALESPLETSNASHLNEIRKFVAGGVMKTLSNMGVIPASISKLNEKSKHLGDSRFTELIPVHVQRAFYCIISSCQDGSHTKSEGSDGKIPPQIDQLVREGKAPYLLNSLVFELLNILVWLKLFMLTHSSKDDNLVHFKTNDVAVDSDNDTWIRGELVEIKQKGWGRFLSLKGEWNIPPSMVANNAFRVGDELEITLKEDNEKHICKIRKVVQNGDQSVIKKQEELELATNDTHCNELMEVQESMEENMINEQIIYFPDKAFKAFLVANFDKDGDGEISREEALSVTEIWARDKGLTSLEGIEFFENLITLNCAENNIVEIDLNKNTKLEYLSCYVNSSLHKISIEKCESLKKLYCGNTAIKEIDVSHNLNLVTLSCRYSDLSSIDLSQNRNLKELKVERCNLTSLDLTNNVELESLNCWGYNLTTLDLTNNKKLRYSIYNSRIINSQKTVNNCENDKFSPESKQDIVQRSDYQPSYGSYETDTYDEYAGSYAQEVMGYSDELINDAFEGDPDLYWNID